MPVDLPVPQGTQETDVLRLELLGSPRLVTAAGEPRPLQRHDAALLAVLALDGPQARVRLARWLWPDRDDPQALRNLRQRLFRLARTAAGPVITGQSRVQLADGVEHDLSVHGAIARGAESLELLGACDYQDLESLAERVDALRSRWRGSCVDALTSHADSAESCGDLEAALRWVERLALVHPASERIWQRLLRLHHLRGDAVHGLHAFERCVRTLRRLGVEPGPATLRMAELLRADGGAPFLGEPKLPLSLARPPRLIGREADWAALADAWHHGRTVVLRGAPGIGKTRLASDFVQAVAPGLAIKARDGDQHQPYALLVHLWKAVSARLPAPEPPVSDIMARLERWADSGGMPAPGEHRVRAAVAQAFEAWTAAGLGSLFIDDVQWADEASLEALLAWLMGAAAAPRTLLTCRLGEPCQALEAWLGRRSLGEVLDHTLGPLDEPAVRGFVASLELPGVDPDAVARTLLRHVGGHPFMMLEVLRSGGLLEGEAVRPDTARPLVDALARRIERLAPGPLRLLRLAALAGVDFSVELAAELLGVHPVDLVDDWAALSQAQLLQTSGGAFDLVVEAARQGVPAPIAQHLHALLAAAGAQRGMRPERMAEHWRSAGRWAEAGKAFERAAEAAAGVSRMAESLRFWDEAAACHELAGDATARWRAQRGAVRACAASAGGAGLIERARALWDQAPAEGADRRDAQLLYAQALVHNEAESGISLSLIEEVFTAACADGDAERQLWAGGLRALAHAEQGRQDLVAQTLALCEPLALGAAPTWSSYSYANGSGLALFYGGDYAASARATRRALELATAMGDSGSMLNEHTNLCVAWRALGRHDDAEAEIDAARTLWVQLGKPDSHAAAAMLFHSATIDLEHGRFDRALESARRARAHFVDHGSQDWTTVVEFRLFHIWYRLGQVARARQALSALAADAGINRRVGRLMLDCRLAAAAGEPVAAKLVEVLQRDGERLFKHNRLSLRLQLVDELPPAQALAQARQALADAQAWDERSMLAPAQLAVADALRRGGQSTQAGEMAALAWDTAQVHRPYNLYTVDLCWRVHLAADGAGLDALSREALRQGLRWIERALPHVPAEYVESFRFRNPVNRALLAKAVAATSGAPQA